MPKFTTYFSVSTYTVKGKTLKKIHNFIIKSGPKVDGKRRYARTGSTIAVGLPNLSGQVSTDAITGEFIVEANVTTVLSTANATSELPKLDPSSKSGLSGPAQKEWAKYLGRLGAHEEGHRICTRNVATRLGTEIEALKVLVKDKTEKQAQADAIKALQAQFDQKFAPAKVKSRLHAEQANYDKTASGKRAQHVELNVTIT